MPPTDHQSLSESKTEANQLVSLLRIYWLPALGAVFILAIAVAISFIIGQRLHKPINPPKIQSIDSSAITPNQDSNVSASGYLEPAGEVIRVSAPAFLEGARVDRLLVKQGSKVKLGDVIAILDSHERLISAHRVAQLRVKVAQSRLEQVKAGAKSGAIKAQSASIEKLKAELQGQRMTQKATIASLQNRLQGEKQAQEATIKRFQSQLKNATTECKRYTNLYKDGAVSTSLRDSKCLEQDTLQEQLKESQANLFEIVGTLQKNISEAQENLNRTESTLQKQILEAEATHDEIAEVRPVDVALAQSELQEALGAVEQAQANLNLSLVRAPRNGQVLKINTWPGELVSTQGIVELGQTSQMYAVAEVYQTDISQIRQGQTAKITSSGFSGTLRGIVDEIGLRIGKKDVLGTDPAADADARVVEVKIRLDQADSQKVIGLTNLEVNIIIDTSQS